MKDFHITAEISLFCDHIEFKEPFEIKPNCDQIKKIELKSHPEKIVVDYLVTSELEREAKELADFHLNFLADRLAFKENIPIKEVKIISIVCTGKEGENLSICVSEYVNLQDSVVVKKIIGKKSIEQISDFIQKNNVTGEIQEYFMMYKEAISERSIGLRFYQLYRLLEKINGNNRRSADEYISRNCPGVETRMSGKNNNERVTIFTWIRDSIHPKARQIGFPYAEISKNVHKLQDLVKKEIEYKL